jgi:hypothetical protein
MRHVGTSCYGVAKTSHLIIVISLVVLAGQDRIGYVVVVGVGVGVGVGVDVDVDMDVDMVRYNIAGDIPREAIK